MDDVSTFSPHKFSAFHSNFSPAAESSIVMDHMEMFGAACAGWTACWIPQKPVVKESLPGPSSRLLDSKIVWRDVVRALGSA